MGLYDDRMADLSEPRRSRTAGNRPRAYPGERPYPSPRAKSSAAASMEVQSLLFGRDAGWTTAKAKKWAKDHKYKYGKVDVTEQYIRIRQFDPKGLKVKRTITLGRGIRAVVAREESMAQTAQARRRTRKKASAPRKRSTRRKTKARATGARRRKKVASTTAAAPKRRRRKAAAKKRPVRRRTSASAWRGDTAGHRKAAKKGVRRRKRRAAPKRRRRTRASEPVMAAAPRRRRRRSAPKRTTRRRTYAAAPRRSQGMGVAELAVAAVSAGFGYVIADGLDRFLATYDPASTEAKPKDKFTSDGAGTLANTLNVASPPGLARIGAGLGLTALPAVAAMYTKGPYLQSALHGLAIGSGVNLFKSIWNNVLMPMLKPKDTSAAALQKSYIARLYPAEVAASINREQKQTAVSSAGGAGALSGAPAAQAGVSAPADVGPFALQDSPRYPDAAQALRQQAGMEGTPGNDYPTVQNVWGTGGESDFPTATQAMTKETGRIGNPGQPGVSAEPWEPGPPPLPGPGPKAAPGEDPACACLGDDNPYLGFVDGAEEEPLYAT